MGFYYWTMNQYISQRLLGARDIPTAAKGAIFAAWLKLLPLFLMVLPGAMAIGLIPDLDRADTVYPRLILNYVPVGLTGLMIAGLMAAIMSSVDSALNSASTLVIKDFIEPKQPQLSTKQLAKLGRATTLIMMTIAVLWAPFIDEFRGLFAYLQQAFAYVTAPLVAAFLIGIFTQRVSASAVFYGTVSGHVVSLCWFIATQLGWLQIHFSIVAGLLFAVSLTIILLYQVLTNAQHPRKLDTDESVLLTPMAALESIPKPVRMAGFLLIVATFIVVVLFR